MNRLISFAAVLLAASAAVAAGISEMAGEASSKTVRVTADRVIADRNTEALVASGNVVAVSYPTRLLSDSLERGTNGVIKLSDPTSVTTCTNCQGHLHWEIKGGVEYKEGEYICLSNAWVRVFEVPIFWIPYLRYPLGGEFSIEIMPGYTSRWGAYLMTKYNYDILGDASAGLDGKWLTGNTRFDLRWKNGIAIGESLKWSLGEWGSGAFKVYYAWDQDAEDRYGNSYADMGGYNEMNWGSTVPKQRYGVELRHRVDVTERDTVWGHAHVFSDTFFRNDFLRTSSFSIKNTFAGYRGNEIAWEHHENLWGFGTSVSGPLNEFVGGTSRLPEFYFDMAPVPVWKLPVNYETQNRLGFLRRQPAEYGAATLSSFSYNPGVWADYETVRFDTYHRLSAPFKLWDVLSTVPRVAFRGTYWNQNGNTVVYGMSGAGSNRENPFRSIFEGGITFAGRGTAWINDDWQHMLEPYVDVLAQGAWYSGLGDDGRPYIFDSLDASSDWSDQFAGRSRNLPYSWCGVTPGIRNAFREADELGHLRNVFDVDAYVSLQCNTTTWTDGGDSHKLAEVGKPNYGNNIVTPIPGARVRWFPFDGAALGGRLEYDSENNKIAQAQLTWTHRISRKFSYHVTYIGRDHRWWDYSSTPVSETSDFDGFNWAKFSYVETGFEHEVCDQFAWAPYIRWDCRLGELDEVGTWIDIYRTDCLGFRLNLAYENEYTRIDGSNEDAEWRIGFYVYLRAFGPGQGIKIGD